MTDKLFQIGREVSQNFPRTTGNLQRDFQMFQHIQELIWELFREKRGKDFDENDYLIMELVEQQKNFVQQMLYEG